MANVSIKFNNKDYLLSCDDGQEESLKKLTKFLDNKYSELQDKLGNIGENKLLLITTIQLIDEYFELVNAPFTLATSQFLLCFLYSLPFVFIFEDPSLKGIYMELFELLYVGVMSSGIAYTLQIFGQRYVKPSTAAITFSLEGVFGSLAAWIILSQMLTTTQIFGCFLILLGVLSAQLIPLINKEAASSRYYSE